MVPSLAQLILGVLLLGVPFYFAMFWSKKSWAPAGKSCYVTGGSSGLGLAAAKYLTQHGANVFIVARDQTKLSASLKELEQLRQRPDQILKAYSHSLTTATGAQAALDDVCDALGGKCPDAIFMCAGVSTPGFFVEQNEESIKKGMDNSYWIQAWTAFAAAKKMARDRCSGAKLVFVSSTLGFFGLVGYSTYSPGKYAIRGLAENLRSELQLYGVDVHCFFPGTIYSPGYEHENKTKPKIVLKIEERDGGLQPEEYAEGLIKGVSRGDFFISADFISHLFRSTNRGAVPFNNVLMDTFYTIFGMIGITDWRRGVDKLVKSHRGEHHEYLVSKGLSK